MEPFQEPSFLSQMMMVSCSSLPLYIVFHTTLPTPLKSKRDWEDDSTTLLMDLFKEKFCANFVLFLVPLILATRSCG